MCDAIENHEFTQGIKKTYFIQNWSSQIIPFVVIAALFLLALVPIIVFIIKTQNSMASLKEDVENLRFYWLDLKGKIGMCQKILKSPGKKLVKSNKAIFFS